MKANYHTHTCRCGHAGGSPIDFVKEALNHNLEYLGLSDHAPFQDQDYGNRMPYDELEEYLQDIEDAKKEFGHKIKIYRSLEIEYLEQYDTPANNYYEFLLDKMKMDYLLLGEHMFYDRNKNMGNIFFAKNSDEVLDYAKACVRAMKTGYFKILAHPDLFGINDIAWDRNFDEATELIIQSAVDTGVVLEYNSNGRRRGIKTYCDSTRLPYPMEKFWTKVKEANATCIVGSDCHSPDALCDKEVESSFQHLKSLGITPLENLDL